MSKRNELVLLGTNKITMTNFLLRWAGPRSTSRGPAMSMGIDIEVHDSARRSACDVASAMGVVRGATIITT